MSHPTTSGSEAGFLFTVPQLQTWRDGGGAPRFEGVAASTSLDRQSERLTARALADMQRFAGMDLLPSHQAGALHELGVVERCWVDDGRLRIAGRLDPTNPEATRLYQRLQAGRRYGLSVGGRVLKAHWEYDPQADRRIRCIDSVELDHVAVCRPGAAANPDTWLGALAKAAEALGDTPDDGDEAAADDTGQTPTETSSAAESVSQATQAKEMGPGGEAALPTANGAPSSPTTNDEAPAKPTPDAETPAAQIEDAVLTSLGRALLDVCRKLWPFSADPDTSQKRAGSPGDATAEGGDPSPTEPQPEVTLEAAPLAALQKQLDDLADVLEKLRKQIALSPSPAAQATETEPDGEGAVGTPEAAVSAPDSDTASPDPVVPGQPQNLPGQTSSANNPGPSRSGPDIWKGVL